MSVLLLLSRLHSSSHNKFLIVDILLSFTATPGHIRKYVIQSQKGRPVRYLPEEAPENGLPGDNRRPARRAGAGTSQNIEEAAQQRAQAQGDVREGHSNLTQAEKLKRPVLKNGCARNGFSACS